MLQVAEHMHLDLALIGKEENRKYTGSRVR